MKFNVVTNVVLSDGKITFHRAAVEMPERDASITAIDPICIYLDPAREPLYSPHPGGGWITPPWERIQTMKEVGEEPEFENLITCKCHKFKHTTKDIHSLEKFGHIETCSRFPKPEVSYLPSPVPTMHVHTPQDIAAENLHSDSIGNMTKATAAFLNLPIPGAPAAKVPEGGLDDITLENLNANLDGSSMQLDEGIKSIDTPSGNHSESVIAGQLFKTFGMSKCSSCGTWGKMNASRLCRDCK